MPTITYVEHKGTEHRIDVEAGLSVMQGATGNSVPGIDADCGGQCACATCQVFVANDWIARVGPPNEREALMLDAAVNTRPNSRLSCQIIVREDLDGLIVHLPERQY